MKIKNIAKLIVGVLILIVLVATIGTDSLMDAASSANPFFLGLAVLITPFPILLKFLIWNRITGITGKKIPLSTTSSMYLIGSFFGMITPSKIGHLIKFRYLQKNGIEKVTALSMSLIERVFDTLIIAAFSVAGILLMSGGAGMFGFSIPVLLALFLVLVSVVFSQKMFLIVGNLILRTMGPVLSMLGFTERENVLLQAYKPVAELKNKKQTLVFIIVLSVLVWVFAGLNLLLITAAFGPQLHVLYAIAVVSIAGAVSLIPITVSGIGTREAAIVALFALAGIPTATALISSLLYEFLMNGIPAIAGGVVFTASSKGNREGIKTHQVREAETE